MTDATEKPEPGVLIRVLSPLREVRFYTTNNDGEFIFRAFEEGVYDYNAPGRILSVRASTNVLRPSPPMLITSPTPQQFLQLPFVILTSRLDFLLFLLLVLVFILIIITLRARMYSGRARKAK